MAYHLTCRSRRGTLAFRTHVEARALWDRVIEAVPDPVALCLMPDHVHLLHARDVHARLGRALSAFARWRNHQRGVKGAVWERQSAPEPVLGEKKLRRSERYIHLNPCRAWLVKDPLAWAWSTHRDRVGLAVPCVRPPVPDTHAFHAYISADPTVHVQGTQLPVAQDLLPLEPVIAAVSEVTRSPWSALFRRGPQRQLLLSSLLSLTAARPAEIALECRVSRKTVYRASTAWGPALRIVARVAGDPRFPGLVEGDLRQLAGWARYRSRT